ncbi:MAG: hypothetical protein FWD57_06380 [Polyangiaceae bacterium]|nr:hypothetical protein [Polyangiaceae bacterium]
MLERVRQASILPREDLFRSLGLRLWACIPNGMLGEWRRHFLPGDAAIRVNLTVDTYRILVWFGVDTDARTSSTGVHLAERRLVSKLRFTPMGMHP